MKWSRVTDSLLQSWKSSIAAERHTLAKNTQSASRFNNESTEAEKMPQVMELTEKQ
jgi:hypothetical protein